MRWRKVELDEVLPLEPESGAAQENVSVVPAPTREEVNDDDHETSDQVATELRRSNRACSALMSTMQLYSCRLVLGLQAQKFVGQ